MLQVRIHPNFAAEKQYVFSILFDTLLGIQWQCTQDDAVRNYEIGLPNGAMLVIEDHFFARYQGLEYLHPGSVPETAPSIKNPFDGSDIALVFGRDVFDDTQPDYLLIGADLVAATFFMLTRWEEYALPDRDTHGRFPAVATLAAQAGFLQRPVVHEWTELLWQALLHLGWPQTERKQRTYRFQLTCDVDHPLLWWSWWARGRTLLGAAFRSVQRAQSDSIGYWWTRMQAASRDPFNTYKELAAWAEGPCHFNFLGQRPRYYDCWYDLNHPYTLRLIHRLAEAGHTIGFHPSKEAHDDPRQFGAELESVRRVTPVPVVSGRHHYLKFAAPHTWQLWEDQGLKMDSTLGYAETEGFRAGICVPYPVFNFLTRRTLHLLEQPLIAMDVSLVQYQKYTPEEAIQRLQELSLQVRRFNGDFVILWHNSSLHTPEWAPFWELLQKTRFS